MNWNLEVHVTRRDGPVVVTPRGEVDLQTVSRLEDALRTATRVPRRPVIVDLTRLQLCGEPAVEPAYLGRAS